MNPRSIPEIVRSIPNVSFLIGPAGITDNFFLGPSVRRFYLQAHRIVNPHIALCQERHADQRVKVPLVGPGIFSTLERPHHSSPCVIKPMCGAHALESIQERHPLGEIRHIHANTNFRPHRSGIQIQRVFTRLVKFFAPHQVTRNSDIPNWQHNARPYLELTGNGVAEITLINKGVYMMVTILGKVRKVVTMVKSHIASDNVPEPAIAVTVTETQTIQIIFHRGHALFLVQLRQGKVFTNGICRGLPTHADFIPLDLFKGRCHYIVLSEILEEIDYPEGGAKVKAVRLGYSPVILLDIGGVQEVVFVRNSLLLVEVRSKGGVERNKGNQPRVESNLELLGTGPFISQNTVGTAIFSGTHAVHAVECRGVVADFIGFRILHVDCPLSAIFHSSSNRIPRHNHHAILGYIDLTVRMVVIEHVIAGKESAFFCSKEILLHESFAIATALHVTGNVQGVRGIQPRKDIPTHVQFVVQVRRIGHHLVHLGFHKVRVPILVHITHIVEIEQRQVKGLGPGFKFRLRKGLAEGVVKLAKAFERFELEQGEGSQLVLQNSPVRVSRVRAGGGTAFGLRIGITRRRAFQQNLGKGLPYLGFRRLVVLAIAYAEALFTNV